MNHPAETMKYGLMVHCDTTVGGEILGCTCWPKDKDYRGCKPQWRTHEELVLDDLTALFGEGQCGA